MQCNAHLYRWHFSIFYSVNDNNLHFLLNHKWHIYWLVCCISHSCHSHTFIYKLNWICSAEKLNISCMHFYVILSIISVYKQSIGSIAIYINMNFEHCHSYELHILDFVLFNPFRSPHCLLITTIIRMILDFSVFWIGIESFRK